MRHIALNSETDWDGWRKAARSLVLAGIEPHAVTWAVGGAGDAAPESEGTFRLPRALVDLAGLAFQAREQERFGLLYSLVFRSHHGESVLRDEHDPDLILVRRMALAVRADAHRMRTLIRFLPLPDDDRLLGWFAPAHFVLPANAQLLARRFPARIWSIITPDGSAHWNGETLSFGSGLRDATDDATLLAWWHSLGTRILDSATEGTSISEAEALDEAPRPPDRPALGPVVLPAVPDAGLGDAVRQARLCQHCPLFALATQTVFGEGPAGAAAMFVGEQPGDQEDTIGRPFVGPAGQLMDRAFEEAGIDRRTVYLTNAVKHFKFTPRGKRRIHQSPEAPEIRACGVWLDQERALIRPRLLVLMGATASRAVLGRAVSVTRERGRAFQMADGQTVFITVHPSYLLRLPDLDAKEREYAAFVRDLTAVRALLEAG